MQRLARQVDYRLKLQDRLSTTLEDDKGASVVAAALHRDGAFRAKNVSTTAVAPFRVPIAATFLLLAAAIFAIAAPSLAPSVSNVSGSASGIPVTVQEVEELAGLAEAAATQQSDAHIHAVVTALEALAPATTARSHTTISDYE